MGRVRTKTIKKAARLIIEKYYPRLTLDFDTNKKICNDVASIPSKHLRNKIAGFVTHLMKRIQKGPVRGISFALQEEERERKDNYVPDASALQGDLIEIDADTKDMLRSIGLGDISGVQVVSLENLPSNKPVFQYRGERRGERGNYVPEVSALQGDGETEGVVDYLLADVPTEVAATVRSRTGLGNDYGEYTPVAAQFKAAGVTFSFGGGTRPTKKAVEQIARHLRAPGVAGVTSIGCGCPLLEFLLTSYDVAVVGRDYNVPEDIPDFVRAKVTIEEVDLQGAPEPVPDNHALLFCYTTLKKHTMEQFLAVYHGPCIVILAGSECNPDPRCVLPPGTPETAYPGWVLTAKECCRGPGEVLFVYHRSRDTNS